MKQFCNKFYEPILCTILMYGCTHDAFCNMTVFLLAGRSPNPVELGMKLNMYAVPVSFNTGYIKQGIVGN